METVSMLLRFWCAKSDSKQWASARLGSFSIIATHQQGKATSDLYRYSHRNQGCPQPGPLLHVSPLSTWYAHSNQEFGRRLYSMSYGSSSLPFFTTAPWHFRMANVFTGWCTKLQHCMLTFSGILYVGIWWSWLYTFLESEEGGRSDIHTERCSPEGQWGLHSAWSLKTLVLLKRQVPRTNSLIDSSQQE